MIQGLPTANARTPYWLTVHNNLNKASNELITGVKPPEQILAEQQKLICIFQRNRPLITVEADHLLRCQADQFRSEATPAFAY